MLNSLYILCTRYTVRNHNDKGAAILCQEGGRIKDASDFFFSLLRRMLSSRFGRVGDVGGGHCFTFATIRAAAADGDDDGEERYPRKIASRDSFFFRRKRVAKPKL